jgi:DNA repair photolyase
MGIERLAREATPLLEKPTAEYLSLEVRSILNRCASSRMPFAWTINPYRGCEYGCRYCYARYTHEFMGLTRWEEFEEKIYVKRGAGRLLLRDLTARRLAGQRIALGTATDPYQPAERRYRVTRSLLGILAQAEGLHLSITTKSDLVARDIDLLRRIALRSRVHVHFTITTLDRRMSRLLECRAPAPERRLAALRHLTEAGVAAGVTLSPVLPDLTDDPATLEAVVAAARAHGAAHLSWSPLFLKPSAQPAVFAMLAEHFPRLVRRYQARFARSAFLDRAYLDRLGDLMTELKRRHGFPDPPPVEPPTPVHEAESVPVMPEQLSLLDSGPIKSEVGEISRVRYSQQRPIHRSSRTGGF